MPFSYFLYEGVGGSYLLYSCVRDPSIALTEVTTTVKQGRRQGVGVGRDVFFNSSLFLVACFHYHVATAVTYRCQARRWPGGGGQGSGPPSQPRS